jgi:glucose-1-phosphatase
MEQAENKLKNIIFDLGGVLIDLDITLTGKAFSKLGITKPVDETENLRRSDVYSGLETGEISPESFRQEIRRISTLSPSDSSIDAAWNAMLLDFPAARASVLLSLKNKYRLFLLSNSNAIHYTFYSNRFWQDYGYEMDSLFEKAYYSFELHVRKPNPEIFLRLLTENGLLAYETLFIDDSFENIQAAAALGLKVYQIVDGVDITQLFWNGTWIG